MTTTIKAADAAQFLSLVPHLLGFTPTRSVVIVPFSRGRSAGGMRVDLPAPDHPDVGAFASTTIGMVCRISKVDGVALVVYCDDEWTAGPPHAGLVEALRRSADACGLRIVDALVVGGAAWGSLLDPRLPAGGRPLDELAAPEVEGVDGPSGDQSAGAELPAASLVRSERVGRALLQLDRALHVIEGTAVDVGERVDPRAFVALCALDDIPSFFEGLLAEDAEPDDPYTCATLVWVLERPGLRDVGLSTWVRGPDAGDAALAAQLRWRQGAEYPAALAEWIMGEGERPDAGRLRSALELARGAASAAPRARRPGALAVCAWLSWALGRSTHAERYARQAVEIEAEHGLGCIMLSMVAAGHLPDWAFRPAAAT